MNADPFLGLCHLHFRDKLLDVRRRGLFLFIFERLSADLLAAHKEHFAVCGTIKAIKTHSITILGDCIVETVYFSEHMVVHLWQVLVILLWCVLFKWFGIHRNRKAFGRFSILTIFRHLLDIQWLEKMSQCLLVFERSDWCDLLT